MFCISTLTSRFFTIAPLGKPHLINVQSESNKCMLIKPLGHLPVAVIRLQWTGFSPFNNYLKPGFSLSSLALTWLYVQWGQHLNSSVFLLRPRMAQSLLYELPPWVVFSILRCSWTTDSRGSLWVGWCQFSDLSTKDSVSSSLQTVALGKLWVARKVMDEGVESL